MEEPLGELKTSAPSRGCKAWSTTCRQRLLPIAGYLCWCPSETNASTNFAEPYRLQNRGMKELQEMDRDRESDSVKLVFIGHGEDGNTAKVTLGLVVL